MVARGKVSYDGDLLDWVFWAREVKGLSPNTVRVRLDFLHRLSTFLGYEGVTLRDAEPHHLIAFERVAIAGRAPESRRSYVCHIRAFYRWAKQTGAVEHDPSEVLTLPSVPRHLPRPIEEDDLAIALKAARPKMRTMIVLAAWAGLRCHEIAQICWDDVHREPDGTAFLHVRMGKGNKDRRVEIGQVVLQALAGYGMKRRGPMFIGQDGRQIDPKSVSRSINRFLAAHGIGATAHQLRHRYGTVAYQVSRDLRLVQQMMGHASPQTTAGYTRPSQEAAGRMVAQMDALAPPSPRAVPDPGGAALSGRIA
jgi:integrase/recombinase XerC